MRLQCSYPLLLLFLLVACTPTPIPAEGTQAQATESNTTESTDWYEVYFTDPSMGAAGVYRGGPDSHLATAIDMAVMQIDIAAHDLNLWSIRDGLIDAHERGIEVRVVAETGNMDRKELQQIVQAGISVVPDDNDGRMHHKFIVIDQMDVWTGSMNFTVNGAYKNDNNLIHITSTELAENYITEFEEMFLDGFFGDDVFVNTPYPELTFGNSLVETYFSPDDGVIERLVELVDEAEESVYILAFAFTSDDLANALLRAYYRGVQIYGVVDEEQYNSNIGSDVDRLKDAGVDMRIDGQRENMHHKVLIIDQEIVVLGSYNFSRSAEERNDENVLIVHDRGFASIFIDEFERIYALSK